MCVTVKEKGDEPHLRDPVEKVGSRGAAWVIFIPVPLVMVHEFQGAPNKTEGIR